jgi:hypothetical protein
MKQITLTAGLGLCAALAVAVSGCSKSTSHHTTPASAAPSSSPSLSAAAAPATRWWSNSAVKVGSTIDPANPAAAAAGLQPSHTDYCGMLSQTLKARKPLLSSAQGGDPSLRTGIEAFVPEISRVAPASITGQWRVLGPFVLAAAKAGQLPSTAGSGTTQALQAVSLIAVDAKSHCGLDLAPLIAIAAGD